MLLLNQKDREYAWGRKASKNIRDKMREKKITYKELVQLLKNESLNFTVKQLENKIYRGTLSAGTYLMFSEILEKH